MSKNPYLSLISQMRDIKKQMIINIIKNNITNQNILIYSDKDIKIYASYLGILEMEEKVKKTDNSDNYLKYNFISNLFSRSDLETLLKNKLNLSGIKNYEKYLNKEEMDINSIISINEAYINAYNNIKSVLVNEIISLTSADKVQYYDYGVELGYKNHWYIEIPEFGCIAKIMKSGRFYIYSNSEILLLEDELENYIGLDLYNFYELLASITELELV